MKKEIHPTYYKETVVACACGNNFTTGSTAKEISVEICFACHPFYTGKQKFVDTAHRVDRFKRIQEKSQALKRTKKRPLEKVAKKVTSSIKSEKPRAKE